MAGALAVSILVSPSAYAKDYVVQKGDTLTKIAKNHSITVSQLQKWNNLKNDIIYVNQKLIVSKNVNTNTTSTTSMTTSQVSAVTSTNSASSTYKVVKGDTLTKIAKKFNVTVSDLKQWNNLKNDTIFIGKSLKIEANAIVGDANKTNLDESGKQEVTDAEARIQKQLASEKSVVSEPTAKGQATYKKAINIAKSVLGVPYQFGGNTVAGFDCSGFVQHVYSNAGLNIDRKDSETYFMKDTTIVKTPVAGDIVFFKNTYRAGISHMGIYLGDGQFIHAGSNGVEISKLQYDYWDSHFVAFKRLNQFVQ